jgi:hypothetical protein
MAGGFAALMLALIHAGAVEPGTAGEYRLCTEQNHLTPLLPFSPFSLLMLASGCRSNVNCP